MEQNNIKINYQWRWVMQFIVEKLFFFRGNANVYIVIVANKYTDATRVKCWTFIWYIRESTSISGKEHSGTSSQRERCDDGAQGIYKIRDETISSNLSFCKSSFTLFYASWLHAQHTYERTWMALSRFVRIMYYTFEKDSFKLNGINVIMLWQVLIMYLFGSQVGFHLDFVLHAYIRGEWRV